MSGISLNFLISKEPIGVYNILAETYLREDSVLLKKKHILSRKSMGDELIKFDDFLNIGLLKSKDNPLDRIISITYDKGLIYLKSTDYFGVEWFYKNLFSNLVAFNKEIADKKFENFNSFVENMNKTISEKESTNIKKKRKFYNYCCCEER